jgi:hypothetical protein
LSDTLTQIQALVAGGTLHISDHGYDELAKDDISVSEVLAGIDTAIVVEDYPAAMRDAASSFYSRMLFGDRFMWFGQFPRIDRNLRY